MPTKAVIAISDTHIGSYAGLCPTIVELKDGGTYSPNIFQKSLLKFYNNFWNVFVPPLVDKCEKVIVILNGDMIDGYHHNTVTLWSNDLDTQVYNAAKLLKPLRTKYDDLFELKGTEAHSGIGNQADEQLARELNCDTNANGEYSSWELWLDIYGHISHYAHHIGVTSSTAYETSAPIRELITSLVENAQWGRKLPDLIVRSHRHRFVPVSIPSDHGRIQCVITPGWQLKTPFTYRIDRMRMPSIGGVVFMIDKETRECQVHEKLYPLPQAKPIKL